MIRHAKSSRKRYGPVESDDPVNDRAFEGLSGRRPSGKGRLKHKVQEKGKPHDLRAEWMIERRSHDGDACLLLPHANAGFPAKVRFNFRQVVAARAMCILAHGLPPTPKHMAIHSCGNGHLSCVNPKHLRWGTGKDNIQDAIRHRTMNGSVPVADEWTDDPSKPAKAVAVEQRVTVDQVREARG